MITIKQIILFIALKLSSDTEHAKGNPTLTSSEKLQQERRLKPNLVS